MQDKGTVVLNGDDELLSGLKGLLKHETLFYGVQEDFDLYAYDIGPWARRV
jgi:UDP-N-acetylmuramoyl-tripeptide--D-alanyl-D-alanine ligase